MQFSWWRILVVIARFVNLPFNNKYLRQQSLMSPCEVIA
jgi:hypothetical protein